MASLPQINNTPHVGAKPHGSASVGLILSDQDGVRNGQQTHQRAVLQKLQDLRFIRQTSGG